MWIEIFSLGSIQRRLIFDKLDIIFEILGTLFVEEPQFFELKNPSNILEDHFLIFDPILNWLFVITAIFVDIDLNKGDNYNFSEVLGARKIIFSL